VEVLHEKDIAVDVRIVAIAENLEQSATNLVCQTAQHIAGSEESIGDSLILIGSNPIRSIGNAAVGALNAAAGTTSYK
jgi:hypothetical protein